MKLFSVSTSPNSLAISNCQKIILQFFSSGSSRSSYSRNGSLYRRISPLGDPNVSIIPVLDKWIEEGNHVNKPLLRVIMKELDFYRRFKHALEVSQWMTDRRYYPMDSTDVAMRINLIFKVYGLERVENYFSNIPLVLKSYSAHLALLNCYAHAKSVDKAEAIMQKCRDMGYAATPMWYNVMMNLHYHLGNWEKLDCLMEEMEEKGIHCDEFTLAIRLSAYAAASDPDGIDRIVKIMESDPKLVLSWNAYAVAADGYLKVGLNLIDKALVMLNKLERSMEKGKRKDAALVTLFRLSAKTGKKDELYRIWNKYRRNDKLTNTVFRGMISSLMKFDDIEGVETIFKEWESSKLPYDFRIPNLLMNSYCRTGDLGKAEALLERGILKGGSPDVYTWCHLAGGYIMENHVAKAINSLKEAMSLYSRKVDFTDLESLTACLEYLEKGNNLENFIGSLGSERIIYSSDVIDNLVCFIKDGESLSYSGDRGGNDVCN